RTDLAVLKIESPKPLPHVSFATDIKLRVGDWVVAVGNPFGLGGTATAGIVSATGREIGRSAYDFIQVDASINQGNSGGPTFDLYGNVVGVNSQILSPSGGNIGIGFAIPARVASKISKELIEKGSVTRGWLGVQVQRVDQDLADSENLKEAKGALVADVVDDSPAEKGGFEDGDIILQLDGDLVEDQRDLTRRVGELFVGHKAKFLVLRDGRKKTLRVTIGKRDDSQSDTSEPDAKEDSVNEFGLLIEPMDDDDRERLGIEDKRGVLIKRVDPATQAARKLFRPGDAILSAGETDLYKPADFEKAVSKARAKGLKAIRVLIRTTGGQTYTALRLDKE
ncbi:HtrA protease/chaperone protein, partial [hydrothermal vent metagenome]